MDMKTTTRQFTKGDKVQTESGAIGTVKRWNRDYTIAVEFPQGTWNFCVAQLTAVV